MSGYTADISVGDVRCLTSFELFTKVFIFWLTLTDNLSIKARTLTFSNIQFHKNSYLGLESVEFFAVAFHSKINEKSAWMLLMWKKVENTTGL